MSKPLPEGLDPTTKLCDTLPRALVDSCGRRINYLRLSVTDRCNLRCRYCMPAGGVDKLEHAAILSFEQFLMIAAEAVALGIEKIRITGGEPLVRKGLVPFLAELSRLPGLRQLALTSNGVLLTEMATDLAAAGVQRLNVSLDSLRPERFAAITRGGELERVLAGIAAAEAAGLQVKINMVVMRGVNDDEIDDFVALTVRKPLAVRFIEYMPTLREAGWERYLVPGAEILERIGRRADFAPLGHDELAGPARNFRVPGAPGSFGVITAISCHFCSVCNRIRVTSTGEAKGCLFAETAVDLKPALQAGDRTALRAALCSLVAGKPPHHQLDAPSQHAIPMSAIGG